MVGDSGGREAIEDRCVEELRDGGLEEVVWWWQGVDQVFEVRKGELELVEAGEGKDYADFVCYG